MAYDITKDLDQQTYPYTKMNFLVTISDGAQTNDGIGAFTEVTGIDASVDIIEFRQGNSGALYKSKIPGLIKHNNVTLKMGYIAGTDMIKWAQGCMDARGRNKMLRKDVTIELFNPLTTEINSTVLSTKQGQQWVLKNAFVASYKGADLDAKSSEVAIESVEIAYEDLVFPGTTGTTTA